MSVRHGRSRKFCSVVSFRSRLTDCPDIEGFMFENQPRSRVAFQNQSALGPVCNPISSRDRKQIAFFRTGESSLTPEPPTRPTAPPRTRRGCGCRNRLALSQTAALTALNSNRPTTRIWCLMPAPLNETTRAGLQRRIQAANQLLPASVFQTNFAVQRTPPPLLRRV